VGAALAAAIVVAAYVELIRNTPFIVQLFFVFFGLPSLGVKLTPELASVIAMVVNLGAYAAEIVRAGIEGTPRGQIEAARSLALTAGRSSCAWCCRRRWRVCGRRW
jgi:polar amino acid transport system permease protein